MGCGGSRPQATPPAVQKPVTAAPPAQPPGPAPAPKPFPEPTAKPTRAQPQAPSYEDQKEASMDSDLELELNYVRVDKRGRVVGGSAKVEPTPEQGLVGAFFEVEASEVGDNALAVKPWIGALKAPTNPPPFKNTAPRTTLELEYIYGYRCVDSRQNLYYTSSPTDIVYMCGAVGVVLNKEDNTQRFFGAGDNNTAQGHDDDVTALAIHPQRDIVATGQLGKNPKLCVWQASNLQMLSHFFQGRDTRAVTCLGFSNDGNFLAAADNHNDHNVRVFDWRKGALLYMDKGGPDKILDLCWSTRANVFCTAGVKHIFFWSLEPAYKKERGIFGQNAQCDMLVARWLPNGQCITGGTTGCLYTWPGKSLSKVLQIHAKGAAVHALAVIQEKVISGGKDNKVVVSTATTLQPLQTFTVESCPRALDMSGTNILCGMRNGTIAELDASGTPTVLMESHSDGEVWGVSTHPTRPELIVTTCDDNKVKVWDSCTAHST